MSWYDYKIPGVVTPEEADSLLDDIKEKFGMDYEVAHMLADNVLLSLLRYYKQDDIADKFIDLDKWYA